MKKELRLIVGASLILITILLGVQLVSQTMRGSSLVNLCYLFNYCPASMGPFLISFLLVSSFLVSLLVLLFFLVPGVYYIKVERTNRLIDRSMWLVFSGFIVILVTLSFFSITCLGNLECFAWGLGILGVPFGLIPAGILYVIALVLLIINALKKK